MNAALNKRRGKRAEVEVSLEDMLPAYLADGHRAGDRAYLLIDWSRGPDAELLSSEARAVIRRTIDRLPDRYRVVLLMRDIEELSNEETAATLGETVSAVKSTLHRARMALREELTRHYGGRP
jgi:RNA polymerase sigma-70 factor (ECF subfamily)